MARKARQRVSYILPLANDAGGHRLGVNGLAVDSLNSVLYSGGRDGVICAWDLNLDLRPQQVRPSPDAPGDPNPKRGAPSVLRQQVQAHTHWINDIVLAQSNEALVSASSDITVKVWRPAAQDVLPPQPVGLHSDYVKVLATPGTHSDWVASGALDRKINLWDLNGGGSKLQINVGEDENTAKGSVYALAVNNSILASGGPESVVRVWDPRNGKRITKFVGHTDNIRDILIAEDGDTIMTASSDSTVKVWSMIAGRCMYTLTMHNDSVWSLYSDHPQLSVFYSSDRSGLVAKTDTRNCIELDEGLSVALCQEHEGVNTVVAAGDHVWTATSSSSINRWTDVNTERDVQIPENYKSHRFSVATGRSRVPSLPQSSSPSETNGSPGNRIPFRCLLRLSNTSPFPAYHTRDAEAASVRKPSEAFSNVDTGGLMPYRTLPDHSIEGQNGLIKHVLLSDRRRVLTLDTAGEVIMWDLLKCTPVKSFGKRHLEDVVPEINTQETVAHWCAVDTRTGSLTCVLEDNYCFDAEMYADELELQEKIDFREDQRINLGKWILRYLFSSLIDEEIRRDEAYRERLLHEKQESSQRANAPTSIEIPASNMNGWQDVGSGPTSASTLRPANGSQHPLATPGMGIGLATPSHMPTLQTHGVLSPTSEDPADLDRRHSHQSHSRSSSERGPQDYFSSAPQARPPTTPSNTSGSVSGEGQDETGPQSPADEKGTTKEGSSLWGKKLKMGFSMKKLRTTEKPEAPKPAVVDEPVKDTDSRSSKSEDKVVEDNFLGAIQRIRQGYEAQAQEGATTIATGITPSLPNETPVLKPPLGTTILIQEDRPDSGGVADLFEGSVATVGHQADLIEKVAPMWLGDVLLRNQAPLKDIIKVSFILEPYQNLLPVIASDGNNRLNANRMLRARKILAYVAERIEPQPEHPDPNALRPEDYLELYCQNQLVPPKMTLATIRAHVWRGGGDVLLYYKANGRKKIMHTPEPQVAAPAPAATAGAEETGRTSTSA